MKSGIHPEYKLATVTCACGNTFQTRTTVGDLRIEICGQCHPFFSGKQKLVDTAGRVEKYLRKFKGKATGAKTVIAAKEAGDAPAAGPTPVAAAGPQAEEPHA